MVLLTLLLFVSSILEVHSHHFEINVKTTEISKEVEDCSKKEKNYGIQFILPIHLIADFETQFYLKSHVEDIFHSPINTLQLLSAQRIALPPPFFV